MMHLPPSPRRLLKDWEIEDAPDGELLLVSSGPGTGQFSGRWQNG